MIYMKNNKNHRSKIVWNTERNTNYTNPTLAEVSVCDFQESHQKTNRFFFWKINEKQRNDTTTETTMARYLIYLSLYLSLSIIIIKYYLKFIEYFRVFWFSLLFSILHGAEALSHQSKV